MKEKKLTPEQLARKALEFYMDMFVAKQLARLKEKKGKL